MQATWTDLAICLASWLLPFGLASAVVLRGLWRPNATPNLPDATTSRIR